MIFPVATNDMNVAGAWTAGYSGKGIKIGVVDTGLEAAHEDLAANVDVNHSFNFLTGANDPTRAANDPGSDHGTMVAGIIGARAFNGLGGRGVAYNAVFAAITSWLRLLLAILPTWRSHLGAIRSPQTPTCSMQASA